MFKKITLAFVALLALSACSSGHNKKADMNGGSMGSGAESSLAADFEKNAGDRVFFSLDSSSLDKTSKEHLQKQVAWLKAHPNVKATVEGHCDERGTREYNLALGERRAEAVKNFLLHNGVDASRLDTVSYGKERPAVVGNDESAWKQNRRAVTAVR